MVVPWRKGSVLEAFMCIRMAEGVSVMSLNESVVSGLYLRMCEAVYSETLRKPWNAVSMAAHSIALSWKCMEEFQRL